MSDVSNLRPRAAPTRYAALKTARWSGVMPCTVQPLLQTVQEVNVKSQRGCGTRSAWPILKRMPPDKELIERAYAAWLRHWRHTAPHPPTLSASTVEAYDGRTYV